MSLANKADSVIDSIDKGLEMYYTSFTNVSYKNSENIGKFKAFCIEEFHNDEVDVETEINHEKAEDCMLLSFDEDDDGINHFPFHVPMIDEDERDEEMLRIMKHCYIHGIPPPSSDVVAFEIDNFHHILEDIEPLLEFHPFPKAAFINSFKAKGLNQRKGLRLNKKVKTKQEQQYIEQQNHMIEIDINDQLKELIGISLNKQNNLFHNDLMALLIDSYHRYYVFTDIMRDNNEKKKNDVHQEQYVYGQLYWKQKYQKKKRFKCISNDINSLQSEYNATLQAKDCTVVLFVNGESQNEMEEEKNNDAQELIKSALNDYDDIIFKFMSSNKYYWSLVKHKELKFFKYAFKNYDEQICGPLTLRNVPKINDNIFVFWMYIWSMSNIVKKYMQSGDITVPLQIDLVIIPNDNTNKSIDNIHIRFNSHNQKFESILCDPTNIDSIQQKLDTIFMKCSIKMKKKENRIVIIIDRRSRKEYFDDKHCDGIFGYKPSAKSKYARIDKKYETINAIWNTSQYIIPPPPRYSELIGATNHNLFVLTYFIRQKSQFNDLFEYDDSKDDQDDINRPRNNIVSSPKTPDQDELFMDGLMRNLKKHHDILNALQSFAQQEEYDTDAFVEDLNDDNSNFAEILKDEKFVNLVKTYIKNNINEDEEDNLSVTSTNITQTTDFSQPAFITAKAKDLSRKVTKHGRYMTSIQLADLIKEVQDEVDEAQRELTKNVTKKLLKKSTPHSRAKTVPDPLNVTELQELQNYLVQVALDRTAETKTVVNTYLFYNKGYCRFEPLDLIRIIPKFFNLKTQYKYKEMLNDFRLFHDKLWELDDDIWMKYKKIYLKSQYAMDEKVIIDKIGTDPKDREKINGYLRNKQYIHDDNDNANETKYNDDITIIKNEPHKKMISLNIELKKLLSWEPNRIDRGMKIIQIHNNLNNIGLDKNELWSIIRINDTNVSDLHKSEIEQLLKSIDFSKGYKIQLIGGIFRSIPKTEHKTDETNIGFEEITIGLSVELNTFLQWSLEQKPSEHGIKVTQISNIGNGVSFKITGITQQEKWYINMINDIKVSNMTPSDFQTFLDKNINAKNGYTIRFIHDDSKTLLPSSIIKRRKSQTNK